MRQPLVLVALCVLVGHAAAQAQKPEEKRADAAPAPAPRLNLKLDNPAQFVREAPPAEPGKAADNLPSLGGNAVTIERTPTRTERPSPYPKDTENNR